MEIIKDDKLVGERIKELRTEKRLTQSELSKYLGIARSTLAGYETGKISPSTDVILRICDFFGVTMGYLVATGIVNDRVFDIQTEFSILTEKLCSSKYIRFRGIELERMERDFLILKIKNTLDEINIVLTGDTD